jgi:phosphoribosyl 1,2-cyclic phosphate phosphodiesterase
MNGATMTVTILGSGTSTGVPVVGCSCAVCTSHDPRNSRTRCSVLISHRGRNILIDTTTDLRQQSLREKIKRIDAVFYTHTHADHVHGIDDLRPFNFVAGQAIPIYGSAETIASIRRNFSYIFSEEVEEGYRPRLDPRQISGPFELFGLMVEPLPLHHGGGSSLGFRIGPFAYLTDCSAIPEASQRRLQDLEVLVIDGLRFQPHSTHFNIPQAVEMSARLRARRTLLTHLSHDVEHADCNKALPGGVELAFDGQQIELCLNRGDQARN